MQSQLAVGALCTILSMLLVTDLPDGLLSRQYIIRSPYLRTLQRQLSDMFQVLTIYSSGGGKGRIYRLLMEASGK